MKTAKTIVSLTASIISYLAARDFDRVAAHLLSSVAPAVSPEDESYLDGLRKSANFSWADSGDVVSQSAGLVDALITAGKVDAAVHVSDCFLGVLHDADVDSMMARALAARTVEDIRVRLAVAGRMAA